MGINTSKQMCRQWSVPSVTPEKTTIEPILHLPFSSILLCVSLQWNSLTAQLPHVVSPMYCTSFWQSVKSVTSQELVHFIYLVIYWHRNSGHTCVPINFLSHKRNHLPYCPSDFHAETVMLLYPSWEMWFQIVSSPGQMVVTYFQRACECELQEEMPCCRCIATAGYHVWWNNVTPIEKNHVRLIHLAFISVNRLSLL